MIRAGLIALAAVTMPIAAVAAAPPPPITGATAVWAEEGHVQLSVTWEGSACEQPGTAEVTSGQQDVDEVMIPTVETAEVCTMQIVEVAYSDLIAVEPTTTTLAVTILDPAGQPRATGSVQIEALAATN